MSTTTKACSKGCMKSFIKSIVDKDYEYRSIDGSNNNKKNPN
jgi:hypothetical protein